MISVTYVLEQLLPISPVYTPVKGGESCLEIPQFDTSVVGGDQPCLTLVDFYRTVNFRFFEK